MPTTPSANENQKALLEQLKDLAQTDAVNSGNQITMLNESILKFEQGRDLFQERYSFWHKFITDYELERKYLDGQYVAEPLVQVDYDSFLNKTGRLWNGAASIPDRFKPVRITQYDGGGLTTNPDFQESPFLLKESAARDNLLSGISSPSFPTGFKTETLLSPSSTTLNVSRSTSATFPTGVKFVVQGTTSAAVLGITGFTLFSSSPDYVYTLDITVETLDFTPIPINANVLNNIPAFSNTERSTKTAAVPARQSILMGLIDYYALAITQWRDHLQLQKSAIEAQTNEDAPNSSYVQEQAAAVSSLTSWLTGKDVSNFGLGEKQNLNTTRVAAIPSRVSWITARLTEADSYNQRYKYSDRVYNLIDGAITTISQLTKQRDALVSQQAANNQRAAMYAAESF